MNIKLAEALLRRKELQNKVDQLKQIKQSALFETVIERRQITDTVDDITAKVPKLNVSQVTAEYDYYAKQLRLIDAAIQQANWTTEIEVRSEVMQAYKDE